jgi:RNAse (barnase) inhibitor barstar
MRSDRQIIEWSSFVAPTPSWACVVVGTKERLERFLAMGPGGDVIVRMVDGTKCSTQTSLFKEWSASLDFPGYFGRNWDAFDDCLTDMSWLPSSSYVIVVTDFETVLPDDDGGFKLLLEVLEDTGKAGVRTAGWPPIAERPGKLTFLLQVKTVDEADRLWTRQLSTAPRTDIAYYQLP